MDDNQTIHHEPIEACASAHQPYNFCKKSHLSADLKSNVLDIHESFAKLVGVNLSSFLRKDIEISVDGIEQQTFLQYTKGLSSPTCISTFDMPPLSGYGVLEINSTIIYPLINRMVGGEGNLPSLARPFTELETAIIKKLLNFIFRDLSNSWKHLEDFQFGFQETYSNPSFIQTISADESCLIITLKAKSGENTGLITLCYPFTCLELLQNKIMATSENRTPEKLLARIQELHRENLNRIELDLSAVLGNISITMEELLSLNVGDVLDLGNKPCDPIVININSKEKFKANPGLIGKYKGVIIREEIIKE